MKVRIEVSLADIEAAENVRLYQARMDTWGSNAQICPLAFALKRLYPRSLLCAARPECLRVYYSNNTFRQGLPSERLLKFMDDFDRGRPVKPAAFFVDLNPV